MKEEQTLPKDEIIKLKECTRMDLLKIRLFHKLDFPKALVGARYFVAASSRPELLVVVVAGDVPPCRWCASGCR